MRRRTVLTWAGIGWLITRVPTAMTAFLAACTGQSQSAQSNTSGFQTVGTIADLDAKGVLKAESPTPILVVRNPSNPASLLAVNPTCTHQGCIVNWSADRKSFVCPCHAAAFAADGSVQNPPATRALETYPVQVEGQNVSVKVG